MTFPYLASRSSNSDSPRLSVVHSPQDSEHTLPVPRLGLDLPRQLAFEKWLAIGRCLSAAASSSAWCLGDWLQYGEISFSGRYKEAVEQTSLDYQTLRNYAWVARKFPLSRRRDTLSFGHHAEVASLSEPEQGFWLRKAEELSWSRNRLRRELRSSLKERSLPGSAEAPVVWAGTSGTDKAQGLPPGAGSAEVLTVEISVSTEQLEDYKSRARRAGIGLESWILLALNAYRL